ncbi:hypothetical protein ACFL4E_02045 [Candidatus Omnitrophota bacterium]
MKPKFHSHRVSLTERRRDKKRATDTIKNSNDGKDVKQMFDTYYRDQVRALYRAVSKDS